MDCLPFRLQVHLVGRNLDAAWQLVSEFGYPAAAIVKHTNPCGCAERGELAQAYRKAFESDPVSAYGGVIGLNRPVDEETAAEIAKTFLRSHRRRRIIRPKRWPFLRPRRICV
jgi:hypothetical protein